MLLPSLPSQGATLLHLRWKPNSDRDLAGYRLRYGTAPGMYSETIDVGNVTEYELFGLDPAQAYYFVVQAYDKAGNESSPSSEILARPSIIHGGTRTVNFSSTADAVVDASAPAQNFGATDTLIADHDPMRRSYIRFDVHGTTGDRVIRAVLRLSVRMEPNSGAAVSAGDLYAITPSAWSETSLTYATSPPVVGRILRRAGATKPGGVVEFEIKNLVTGDGTYEFALVNRFDDGAFFFSREAGPLGPKLLLTVQMTDTDEHHAH